MGGILVAGSIILLFAAAIKYLREKLSLSEETAEQLSEGAVVLVALVLGSAGAGWTIYGGVHLYG